MSVFLPAHSRAQYPKYIKSKIVFCHFLFLPAYAIIYEKNKMDDRFRVAMPVASLRTTHICSFADIGHCSQELRDSIKSNWRVEVEYI